MTKKLDWNKDLVLKGTKGGVKVEVLKRGLVGDYPNVVLLHFQSSLGVSVCTDEGVLEEDGPYSGDSIKNLVVKKSAWLNIYNKGHMAADCVGTAWPNKERADFQADINSRLSYIEVEWEE